MAKVRICDLCGKVIESGEMDDQTIKVKRKHSSTHVERQRGVYIEYADAELFFHRIDCHNKCIELLFEAADATRKARAACADTKFDDAYTEWKKMADKVMDLEK